MPVAPSSQAFLVLFPKPVASIISPQVVPPSHRETEPSSAPSMALSVETNFGNFSSLSFEEAADTLCVLDYATSQSQDFKIHNGLIF